MQGWKPPKDSPFKYPEDKICDMLHDGYTIDEAIKYTANHFNSSQESVMKRWNEKGNC